MSTFQERLALAFSNEKIRREQHGEPRLTKTMLWKAAKATSGACTQWFDGTTSMKLENCYLVSPVLRVNPRWLFDGTERMELSPSPDTQAAFKPAESAPQLINLSEHPDLKAVPRVRFKLSAGVSGYSVEPEDGNSKPVFFRKDWFEMHNYKPEKLFAVRVTGASMEPALWDSDLVVINTADTTPHDGDVFAMNYEGELVIKRMRRDAGEWWACSDNADQRRFAPKRCTDEVKIIGRVIYKQSERI